MAAYAITQSTTTWALVFFMTDSSDHVSGKTGLSPTVTLSKNGGSFASPAGAVSEIASGWYKVAGNAADTNTLGPLLLHATGSGADSTDMIFEIVAYAPQTGTNLGLSALPTATAGTNTGLPIVGTQIPNATAGAANGLFIAGTNAATTVTTALTTTFTGNLTGSVGSVTGAVGSVTGAVGSITGNVGGNVTGSVASVTAAVTLSAGDSPVMQSGTAAAGGASTITIATALGADSLPVGCTIKITSGTGVNQARIITAYVNATKVVTVDRAWTTQPDNTSIYSILYGEAPALSSGLKITGVVLTDSLTTYINDTPQSGDSYARIGTTGSGLTSLAPSATALSTAQWTNTLATNLGTLAGHDPGATLGTSTLTQAQVTGGAYSVQSSSCVLGDTRIAHLDVDVTSRAPSATALSTAQWTSARAGYLDNLNVGGAVASQADVQAVNQSASKHLLIQTVGQYERPESGSTSYTVEVRTFSASTGAAVNADSTPTISPVGVVSGDLSANLGAVSNPATGVYRATYTVSSAATQEQIRFDTSATIASSTFTLSCFTQVVDLVSVTWTGTDATHLTAIFNKLPTNNIADETLVLAAVANVQSDTDDIQSRLPAALTGDGNIKADTLRVGGTAQTARDLGLALPAAAPNANGGLPILSSAGTTLGYTVTTATNLTNAATSGDLTTTMKASVNTEVDTALSDIKLDKLISAAESGDVANSSIIARMVSKSVTPAFSSYVNTTDSLEALRDRGDVAWTTGTGTSTLTQADVRTAIGMASANLDLQLGAIDDFIDTEIAAIKAKTDLIPASPAAVGSAMTLTLGERDSIAAALLDLAAGIEMGMTLRQAVRLLASVLLGKSSNGGSTFRDVNDSKDRVIGTVDGSGNRTVVTLDAS